jgi:phosphoglycerol transferase MdoB-like AlkP superfamily enzyme
MLVFRLLTARLRFALALFLINFGVFLAFRVAFALLFYRTSGEHAGWAVQEAFYLGSKFDMRLAILALLPVLLLSWLPGLNIVRSRWARRIWMGYLALANLTYVLFYLLDFPHFAYLGERLNVTVLSQLIAPEIALKVAWESYPLVWGLLGLAALTVAISWAQWKLAFPLLDWQGWPHPRWRKAAMAVACVPLLYLGVLAKTSIWGLRWSEAYFVADPYVNALALNPMLFFFDTYGNRATGYDENAVRAHYDEVAAYLGVEHPDKARLNFTRVVQPQGITDRPYNVVLIHLESFAARFTGTFGNPLSPTPHFDALARQGLLFTNFYTPRWGTARSVFTALTGLPDITEGGTTASRVPELVNQHILFDDFKGYKRFYMLGGSATWGNIRGLVEYNIKGLQLYEEGRWTSPSDDGWGISDLKLFREANAVLRQADHQPFVAMIQTAGNHQPFTIPDDHGDFKLLSADPAQMERAGLEPAERYNSLRFLDYCLAEFFAIARKESYFDHTIFLMYGDHGIAGDGVNVAPAQSKLLLTALHVPFLIYAPKLFPKGRVMDEMATEMDMLPTVAGIVGLPYRYNALGRDLLDARFDGRRFALTLTGNGVAGVGLVDREFFFRRESSGPGGLYRYRSTDPEVPDVGPQEPERLARMGSLAEGLFETARYLMQHNRREDLNPAGPAPVPVQAAR